MLRKIKDDFGKKFKTKWCYFYLCEDEDSIAAYYGTYKVGKFSFDELKLTNREIAQLEKDGEL